MPAALVSRYAKKADYQKTAEKQEESQLQMLTKLALEESEFVELKQYCKKCGIGFLSTPFDLHSIDFLDELGVDFWKIPSGEVTNYPYLAKIGKTKKKIVMSTGMCEMSEIQDAIEVLEENGADDITILHCNTEYPTPFEDVNLSAMAQMKNELKKPVGYSDHRSTDRSSSTWCSCDRETFYPRPGYGRTGSCRKLRTTGIKADDTCDPQCGKKSW